MSVSKTLSSASKNRISKRLALVLASFFISFLVIEVAIRWLGEYDVDDGLFSITFDDAETGHWTYLTGFHLDPLSPGIIPPLWEDEETLSEKLEWEERLRALGYVE